VLAYELAINDSGSYLPPCGLVVRASAS